MYDRNDLVEIIKPWAKNHAFILAAWEGGSRATNRLDRFSDLDLSLIVLDDKVEDVFNDLDIFLKKIFKITRSFRVPEPAWHGFSQCFYDLDDVSPFVYLDVVLIKENIKDKLTEIDRHGLAHVWFDKKNIYKPSHSSQDQLMERAKKLYISVTQTDFLIITEADKNIARGYFIDAFPAYYAFINRHLAVMLNLKYRIERADFGLRYARIDYDHIDLELLEESFKVSSIDDMKITFEKVKTRYHQLKEELEKLFI